MSGRGTSESGAAGLAGVARRLRAERGRGLEAPAPGLVEATAGLAPPAAAGVELAARGRWSLAGAVGVAAVLAVGAAVWMVAPRPGPSRAASEVLSASLRPLPTTADGIAAAITGPVRAGAGSVRVPRLDGGALGRLLGSLSDRRAGS
jgi:hypothetical protein